MDYSCRRGLGMFRTVERPVAGDARCNSILAGRAVGARGTERRFSPPVTMHQFSDCRPVRGRRHGLSTDARLLNVAMTCSRQLQLQQPLMTECESAAASDDVAVSVQSGSPSIASVRRSGLGCGG